MSKELAALVTISPALRAAQRPNAAASFRVGAGDCAHGSCRPFRAAARPLSAAPSISTAPATRGRKKMPRNAPKAAAKPPQDLGCRCCSAPLHLARASVGHTHLTRPRRAEQAREAAARPRQKACEPRPSRAPPPSLLLRAQAARALAAAAVESFLLTWLGLGTGERLGAAHAGAPTPQTTPHAQHTRAGGEMWRGRGKGG